LCLLAGPTLITRRRIVQAERATIELQVATCQPEACRAVLRRLFSRWAAIRQPVPPRRAPIRLARICRLSRSRIPSRYHRPTPLPTRMSTRAGRPPPRFPHLILRRVPIRRPVLRPPRRRVCRTIQVAATASSHGASLLKTCLAAIEKLEQVAFGDDARDRSVGISTAVINGRSSIDGVHRQTVDHIVEPPKINLSTASL